MRGQRVFRKYPDFHFPSGPLEYKMTCPRSIKVCSRLWKRIIVYFGLLWFVGNRAGIIGMCAVETQLCKTEDFYGNAQVLRRWCEILCNSLAL